MIDYLTPDATRKTLHQLAGLAAQSAVTISYNPSPDGTDPLATEAFEKASQTVDATGESYLGFYSESEIERGLAVEGVRLALRVVLTAAHKAVAERG